jgi:N6-L-threonylcarbamoyladenine synthase
MIALAAAMRCQAGLATLSSDHRFAVRPRWDLAEAGLA